MSAATTLIVIITVISSFVLSLVTGAGVVTAFQDLEEPTGAIDWIVFSFEIIGAIIQVIFAVMTFDIIPGLPTEIRIVLSTIFAFIFIKWIIKDVVPAIGSITPFT